MPSNEPGFVPRSRSIALRETPLIDRVEEMELLKDSAEAAIRGEGCAVFVHGEAGIGKTRLTRELRPYVHTRGMQVLYGRCPSLFNIDSIPPYVLWKEVIRDFLQICTPEQLQSMVIAYPSEICKIVPEMKQKLEKVPESPALSPEQERDRLFEAVSQFIENISKTMPLIVFLDDLQWCDPSSLLLLHYLARGVFRDSLLLVGAYRDTEVQENHPLIPVLTELKRERLVQSTRLKRLSADEVTCMIKQILWQDDVPQEFCKLVYEKTRGNPFFVEEVMQSLQEEGVVYPYGAEYRFKEVSEIEFPETVKNVLQARLGRLDNESQQTLTLASFIGNDFTFEALKNVTESEENELLQIVERMMEKKLLTCRVKRGEETCTFSDVLIRDVLYESVGPLRRKKLHGVVGRALEKVYAGKVDEHLGELAAHFLESGDRDKAMDYFLQAGEKAAKVYANNEAGSYYESALELLKEKGGDPQEKARILEALGDVKSLIGEYRACIKYWNEASLLWKQLGEKASIARLYRKSSNVLLHKMGNTEEAKEHQLKALEILEAEPESVELVKLRADMAHMYWHIGDTTTALPLAEKALETAQRLNSQEAIADAYLVWGKILGFMGQRKKTVEGFEKALQIAIENGYAETAAEAYLELAGAKRERSPEYLQKGYEVAQKAGAISAQSWIGNHLAGLCSVVGNKGKALSLIEEAVLLDRKTGNLHNLSVSLSEFGRIKLRFGDYDEAEKLLNEALEISQKQNMIPAIANAYAGLGMLHSAKDEHAKAIEFFEKSIEIARKAGIKSGESFGHYLVWETIALGELEKAENLINVIQKNTQPLDSKADFIYTGLSRAMLLRAQKKWTESISYFEKVLQQPEALKIRSYRSGMYARKFLSEYARVFIERNGEGDREKARNLLNQSLEIFQRLNAKKDIEKIETLLVSLETGRPISWELKPPNLVSTGCVALDKLLYGGIQPGLTVTLLSPSCDERDFLVKSFLETGAKKGEPTFLVATDPYLAGSLVQELPSIFHLFVCNPQAEASTKGAPNVYTLKGIENLTNINIALTQAVRRLGTAQKSPRRLCLSLLSDILLQHGSILTRKWLIELFTQLKGSGFTILAVLDPQMHSTEQLHAVLGLFDGEIDIREKETEGGLIRFLRVRRMSNQKYSKDEVGLTEE